MTAFYVMGIVLVVWALSLSAVGLLRGDFPPTGEIGRALMAVSALLVAGILVALFVTSKKEHPREEAKAEAAAQAAEQPAGGGGQGGGKVEIAENEFSVQLAGGNSLKAGKYTFEVANQGKIQHNLVIEGPGVGEAKTPLVGAGRTGKLKVDLEPGSYKFYCSVPGHEAAGMKTDVTAL
jgi:uncharacterized cupredoxin-like copper-binding protein